MTNCEQECLKAFYTPLHCLQCIHTNLDTPQSSAEKGCFAIEGQKILDFGKWAF